MTTSTLPRPEPDEGQDPALADPQVEEDDEQPTTTPVFKAVFDYPVTDEMLADATGVQARFMQRRHTLSAEERIERTWNSLLLGISRQAGFTLVSPSPRELGESEEPVQDPEVEEDDTDPETDPEAKHLAGPPETKHLSYPQEVTAWTGTKRSRS